MSASATTERKSFLPLRLRSTTVVGSSNIPTPTRSITFMPLGVQNDSKLSFTVGERVLVNNIKLGTLRYAGTVKFARGLFYGVELDDPEGKHDGQVNDFRYFQCKSNHGVFVPYDKVVLAPRERALSRHRAISRLKPPTTKRSMTISSPINYETEQVPSKTSSTPVQLPDIIPSPLYPSQPISITKIVNTPIVMDDYELMTPTEESRIMIHSQPLVADEPSETIEADFTDSVSLILHQLQQEQRNSLVQPRGSLTISEGSVNDDDEDDGDYTDDMDSESVTGSSVSDKLSMIPRQSSTNDVTKSVQTELTFDVHDNMFIFKDNLLDSQSLSNSNKSLASSTTSINSLRMTSRENKTNTITKRASIPTSMFIVKKDTARKASIPLLNPPTASRRLSMIPSKKGPLPLVRQNRIDSQVSFSSQSKLNPSHSSSNSIDDSHSETISNQQKSSKITSKPTVRAIPYSTDITSDSKSRHSLDALDQQSMIHKAAIQSLESAKEHFKTQYQRLLHQFDVMSILSQYCLSQNEQFKQHYELQLFKARISNNQLKSSIEQIQTSHRNELATLDEQHRNAVNMIKELHQQQMTEHQQQVDQLLTDKIEIEIHCQSLQEQVDRFMEEMANSEHADPLLRRVEILEKDRNSLQTVLEIRNQELTQLRTKINEQVFQREDQLALQKRIDMAENRNQDLVCLLRNWQLNEKAGTVERDQLKEYLAQMERDNRQLTFENETLLYRLRQQPLPSSSKSKLFVSSPFTQKRLDRAHSISAIMPNLCQTECLPRALSLNHISNR